MGVYALKILSSALKSVFRIGKAILLFPLLIFKFIGFILSNFRWIFFLLFIIFFGIFWINFHVETITGIEFVHRCFNAVFYELNRPWLSLLADTWDNLSCWLNAVGLLNRLFNKKILRETLTECLIDVNIVDSAVVLFRFISILVTETIEWIFIHGPFSNRYPAETVFFAFCDVLIQIEKLAICLCGDLRFIFQGATRILIAPSLKCAISQLINSIIAIFQSFLTWFFNLGIALLEAIFTFSGDTLQDIIDALQGTGELGLPRINLIVERFNAGITYISLWLNDIIQILICTIVAESEAQGDAGDIPAEYAICLADPDTRIELFDLLAPIISLETRLIFLFWDLMVHVGRIKTDFLTLPASDRFLLDVWDFDIIWDTLRDPPEKFDYSSDLNNPSFIIGSNISSIDPLNNIYLYGNQTIPPVESCNNTILPVEQLTCQECDRLQDKSVERCLCNLGEQLDLLIAPLVEDKNFFKPILCCFFGRIIRVIVAILRPLQRFVLFLFNPDRFDEFWTDQNNFEIIFTEIAGRPGEIGGLLECCKQFFDQFDERLECLCKFIILPLKSINEGIRIFIIAIVRLFNDIFNTSEPGILDYLCVSNISSTNCVDLEVTIFQWLRKPRIKPVFIVNHDYVPIFVSNNDDRWIDCLCKILNLQFIAQFIPEIDEDDIPDFCCGIQFTIRVIIELINFGLELVLIFIENVAHFINGGSRVLILEYLACKDEKLCSNGPELISDLKDLLNCPCVLLRDIDNLINNEQENIPCLCDISDAIIQLVISLIQAAGILAAKLSKLFDCIITDSFNLPECSTGLGDRTDDFFNKTEDALDSAVLFAQGLGCILGELFNVPCNDGTNKYFNGDPSLGCLEEFGEVECTTRTRFEEFFKQLAGFIIGFFKIILDFFRGIIDLISGGSSISTVLGLSTIIDKFLTELAGSLWGTAANGDETEGLLQSLGLLLNCIVGPDNTSCNSEQDPEAGKCFGDFIHQIANAIRDLFTEVKDLIISLIEIFECLLSATCVENNLGTAILKFIDAIFALIEAFFSDLAGFLKIVFNVVVAIIRFFFGDAIGTIFEFLFDVLLGIISVIINIINTIIDIFGKKRMLHGMQEILQTLKFDPTWMAKYPKFNQTTIDVLTNRKMIVDNMVQETWCYKVITTLINKQTFDEMDFAEEGAWKICYIGYASGIMFNAAAGNDKNILSSDDINDDDFFPKDFFYNPSTFLNVSQELLITMKVYYEWKTFSNFNLYDQEDDDDGFDVNDPLTYRSTFVDLVDEDEEKLIFSNLDQPSSPHSNIKRYQRKKRFTSTKTNYYSYVFNEINNITSLNNKTNTELKINNKKPILFEGMSFKDVMKMKGCNNPFVEKLFSKMESLNKKSLEEGIIKNIVRENYIKNKNGTGVATITQLTNNNNNRKRSRLNFVSNLLKTISDQIPSNLATKVTKTVNTKNIIKSSKKWKYLINKHLKTYPKIISNYFKNKVKKISDNIKQEKTKHNHKRTNEIYHPAAVYENRSTRKTLLISNNGISMEKLKKIDPYLWFKQKHNITGSVFMHRLRLLRKSFKNILNDLAVKTTLSNSNIPPNIHTTTTTTTTKNKNTILNKLYQKHNNILKNRKLSPFTKVYQIYQKIRHAHPTFTNIMPKVDRKIHNSLVFPDGNVNYFYDGNKYTKMKRTNKIYYTKIIDDDILGKKYKSRFKYRDYDKKNEQFDMLQDIEDLCIVDEVTTCDNCLISSTEECSVCTDCTNCTRNPRECKQCDGCLFGDPEFDNCTLFKDCTNCKTTGFCFDCLIIETFITDAISIIDFCVQIAQNNTDVIKRAPANKTKFEIVSLTEEVEQMSFGEILLNIFTDQFNAIYNLLNKILGFDIFATIAAFITNTNTDPFDPVEHVGLFYTISSIRSCNRDQHLMCEFGLGLEKGLLITIIIFIIFGFLAFILLPPIGGLFVMILSLVGGPVIFFSIVGFISWGYNPRCSMNTISVFVTTLLPFTIPVVNIPLVPSCAGRQTLNLLDKIFQPCLFTLGALTSDGITCPPCPNKLNLIDCFDTYGLDSLKIIISYLIQLVLPPDILFYLKTTALVQGSCILDGSNLLGINITFNNGPLSFIFNQDFNLTNPQVTQCFNIIAAPAIALNIVFVLIIIFLIILFLPTFITIIQLILSIFVTLPFSLFLPPWLLIILNSLLGPYSNDNLSEDTVDSLTSSSNGGGSEKKVIIIRGGEQNEFSNLQYPISSNLDDDDHKQKQKNKHKKSNYIGKSTLREHQEEKIYSESPLKNISSQNNPFYFETQESLRKRRRQKMKKPVEQVFTMKMKYENEDENYYTENTAKIMLNVIDWVLGDKHSKRKKD